MRGGMGQCPLVAQPWAQGHLAPRLTGWAPTCVLAKERFLPDDGRCFLKEPSWSCKA